MRRLHLAAGAVSLFAMAVVAAVAVWMCSHPQARAAQAPALFHDDPSHISNRLYYLLHVRTRPNGEEHGFDSLDPLLWSQTKYLLIGQSHKEALAAADEFLSTQAERQLNDPVRRAVLQRDVWAVFDWADASADESAPYPAERRELMMRLAPIVKRLAFSPNELAHLPDTYARAVHLHEFPTQYDPANPNQAFLPPDLLDANGSWVCLGAPRKELAAPLHDLSFTARSVFFVFARLPGGPEATLAYFKRLADMKIPLFVRMQNPGYDAMDVWNPDIPQFPVGTEFALVRRLVLPDREGKVHLTPVTESVQIRHYTAIPSVSPMASRDVNLAKHFQAPSEIELSRHLLFSGVNSGLRGVTESDEPFLIFPAMMEGFDAFEDPGIERFQRFQHLSPFVACTSCHLGPGIQSMMSFSFRGSPHEVVFSPRLAETTPNQEAEKVITWASTQRKFKDLLNLWGEPAAKHTE